MGMTEQFEDSSAIATQDDQYFNDKNIDEKSEDSPSSIDIWGRLNTYMMRFFTDPLVKIEKKVMIPLVTREILTSISERAGTVRNTTEFIDKLISIMRTIFETDRFNFKEILLTAIFHYSDSDNEVEKMYSNNWKYVMKNIDSAYCENLERTKPVKYTNLMKFLDNFYDYNQFFDRDVFLHKVTNNLASQLQKKGYAHINELKALIRTNLTFLIIKKNINIQCEHIDNQLDEVFNDKFCEELCQVCKLDGIDIDYEKLTKD